MSFHDMSAVLDPAIEAGLVQGYNDQGVSLVVDCLELLLFSDDPAAAVGRIEGVMARFKYLPHQFRDLIVAMGHTRSEAVVPFVLGSVRSKRGVQEGDSAWIESLGRLNLPAARQALLSFVDPQIQPAGEPVSFDFRDTEQFAAYIADWARSDSALKERILKWSEASLTPLQKKLLTAIYGQLRDDEAAIADANLLPHPMSLYGIERGLETVFVEHRPYDDSGSFTLVPRNARDIRAKLFRMVLDDPARSKAAFSILGQVEVWRLEQGRPIGEPRHPLIESDEPWPPLSRLSRSK